MATRPVALQSMQLLGWQVFLAVLSSRSLKVGYLPHSVSLTHPGDRRRFVFFARETRMPFEIADARREYDVVFLTSSCNISEWIVYKRRYPRTKLIFELTDSYLLERASVEMYLKGAARFLTGREARFFLDYRKAFIEIVRLADAAVCSTPVQRTFIQQHNRNVHVSLDYFRDEIPQVKLDHRVGDRIRLVWEGQSYTLENISILRDAFKLLRPEIELHVVTDETIAYPFGFSRKARSILDKLGIDYVFHPWQYDTFSAVAVGCDLALIPLDRRKELMWQKPENKLLFFWQLRLPALTSPSPAYKRVMDAAGVGMYAADPAEWVTAIRRYKDMPDGDRAALLARTDAYINEHHSKAAILDQWRAIFESVGTP